MLTKKMIDYNQLQETQKSLITKYVLYLSQLGYGKVVRIPTFEALAHYKNSLLLEDLYYRYIDSDSLLLFKECGHPSIYISTDLKDKYSLFRNLLTSGLMPITDCKRWIGQELIDCLKESGLLYEEADEIKSLSGLFQPIVARLSVTLFLKQNKALFILD